MTPIEMQRQAVELLNHFAKEAISPRKRGELANVVKKQIPRLETKQTDKDVAGNLNYLHDQISKALKTFPNLRNRYPTAMTFLAEIEASARKNAGELAHPDRKSGV